MLCQNRISESMFVEKNPKFMDKIEKVFDDCRFSRRKINDALKNMLNTFTVHTNEGYSLVHDSVYEVLAFCYGNEHQEDMLMYMSSSFVAKKITCNEISDNPEDLHIKIHKCHYQAFAKRLIRDLKSFELHHVFTNTTLKVPCICSAFIDELEKMSNREIQGLFFLKLEDTSNIFVRSEDEGITQTLECEQLDRQRLLVGDMRGTPNIRVISWVISYGHKQLLQYLFENVTKHQKSIRRVMGLEIPNENEDIYISDLKEQTRLLLLSCYSDDLEMVKLVLKHCDAECLYKPRSDFIPSETPLTVASELGNKPMVDELIQRGAYVDQPVMFGITALHVAAKSGHLSIVESLVNAGADCNFMDAEGKTPLFVAAHDDHPYVVDYLFKHRGNVNKPDISKKTPLHAASKLGYRDVVKQLIECNADLNESDISGRTPLYEASEAGHYDVVNLLISCGADCNKSDESDRTPLYVASEAGHRLVVDALIKCGADSNKNDISGKTPLYVASDVGHDAVVNLLIMGGADCNQSDKDGRSPLFIASEADQSAVVDLLIKGGADCNQGDIRGRTPLHAVFEAFSKWGTHMSGYESILRNLIESGADINQSDLNGECPLTIARKHNQHTIIDKLMKHFEKLNLTP